MTYGPLQQRTSTKGRARSGSIDYYICTEYLGSSGVILLAQVAGRSSLGGGGGTIGRGLGMTL